MQIHIFRKRITLTAIIFYLLFFFQVASIVAFPYTAEITTLTATIDTSSSSTYEKTIGVKLIWRINYDKTVENFTTVYSYVYCKVNGKSAILAADQATEGGSTYWYTNYTSITETLSLNIDEDSVAGSDLYANVKIVIYAELYNNSISAANKLTSKTTSISYGILVGTAAEEEKEAGWGLTEILLLALMGIGAFAVIVFFIALGQKAGIIPSLGILKAPSRDTLDYGDHTMWAERYGSRDREVLEGRKKPGQFKKIVDPGRSRSRDLRETHLYGRKNLPDADRRPPKGRKKW